MAREERQQKLSLPETARYTSLTCRAAAYLNNRMNRSRLALASFGTNYRDNATLGNLATEFWTYNKESNGYKLGISSTHVEDPAHELGLAFNVTRRYAQFRRGADC